MCPIGCGSRLDRGADEHESRLLAQLGFESVLMVCLPSSGSCWGLVEVYNEQGGFDERRAELASRLALETGALLERLESSQTR